MSATHFRDDILARPWIALEDQCIVFGGMKEGDILIPHRAMGRLDKKGTPRIRGLYAALSHALYFPKAPKPR